MNYLTYNLEKEVTNRDYYLTIELFVNNLLCNLSDDFIELLADYKDFLNKNKIEKIRSDYEYIYDILFLGVIYKLYYPYALRINRIKAMLFSNLIKLRAYNGYTKEISDKLRGILATIYLVGKSKSSNNLSALKRIELLNLWLESTNEFREEVKRTKLIAEYLNSKNSNEQFRIFSKIMIFSKDFIKVANDELSVFTKNVNGFIKKNINSYKWKEDYLFCGRKEVEYHLSMTGAELLNRAFKEKYLKTSKKALLLPACMREKTAEKCKAIKKDLDLVCTGCSATCRINKIKSSIKKLNCETYIIPHSSNFTQWLKKWANTTEVGVIGVACPLNLMQGGLELKALEIPSQCILLDYCGCTNHWSSSGFPTSINEEQLLKVIRQN